MFSPDSWRGYGEDFVGGATRASRDSSAWERRVRLVAAPTILCRVLTYDRAMRPTVAALVFALALGGCAHSPHGGHTAMKYLALGDSYTIGEGADPNERWPVQLAGMLREAGFNVQEPVIIAKTGWTTDELNEGMKTRLHDNERFDLVTLLIGVNNQYRGREIEEYRQQFTGLLQAAVQLAGGEASRVVVVSIPDWGVTPYAGQRDRAHIASEIDRFNAVNREVAEHAGVGYVDVTGISRRHGDDPAYLMADGLHPSGRAYHEWAEAVVPKAKAALRSRGER